MNRFISHRGNVNGPNPTLENSPRYILAALVTYGVYGVEVDAWHKNGRWYLGHDEPTHEVPIEFLNMACLWVHAKNTQAVIQLQLDDKLSGINWFWHETDRFALTSKGYIWTCDREYAWGRSVYMNANRSTIPSGFAYCSDYHWESHTSDR